jgi:hypothetical protein
MAEEYIESMLIRQDGVHALVPTFEDTDMDVVYEFEGTVRLVQTLKSVQNAVHNRHDYIFRIVSIDKMQKEV